MCGVCALLFETNQHAKMQMLLKRLQHRGPDGSGIVCTNSATLGHTRLAINGIDSGAQPLVSENEKTTLTINGEIYNYKELVDDSSTLRTSSSNDESALRTDCDIIIKLWDSLPLQRVEEYTYEKFDETSLIGDDSSGKYHYPLTHDEKCIEGLLNSLRGDFAFVLVDETRKYHLVARDPIGVVPLYYGFNTTNKNKELGFASEMKCLSSFQNIRVFPPGAYYDGQLTTHYDSSSAPNGEPFLKWWYKPIWRLYPSLHHFELDSLLELIRKSLTTATRRRLMSDAPIGVLLSGGLDSSVIAAITSRLLSPSPIETFSIGLEGSPDLEKAKDVANHLHSKHHSVTFTVQEGLDVLKDVIRNLETYDVTSIRASTPMYLLAKYITSSTKIKSVLSGEGSDEIFGGYLYFHNSPSPEEFRNESIRRINALHLFDCLRANKSCMAHSLETRVPFLDRDFLDAVMTIHPEICLRDGIEKWVLRKAFEDYLPSDIMWRQKEQFSDGVGSKWIESLISEASHLVSDEDIQNAFRVYPYNTPTTKEAYWYRQMFEEHFSSPKYATTVQKWIPMWSDSEDPSGLSQKVHLNHIE